jgi:2'-5' RNA ligase
MGMLMHRLFFAVRPPAAVGVAVEQVAAGMRAGGLLRGHWIRAAKYHVTTLFLGSYAFVPDDLVERAKSAADAIAFAPFDITLDRVSSFPGRRQSPCILCCSQDSAEALRALWAQLRIEASAAGMALPEEETFTPHLTIAYANRALPEAIPIEPLRWRVEQFFLLHSDVGDAAHRPLGSWRLGV